MKKNYTILGSTPGDGYCVEATSIKDALIKKMIFSDGLDKKTAIEQFDLVPVVKSHYPERFIWGDYEIIPEVEVI